MTGPLASLGRTWAELQDATMKAGRALVADASVAKEPAILTELAAALTVLRLDAAGMGMNDAA